MEQAQKRTLVHRGCLRTWLHKPQAWPWQTQAMPAIYLHLQSRPQTPSLSVHLPTCPCRIPSLAAWMRCPRRALSTSLLHGMVLGTPTTATIPVWCEHEGRGGIHRRQTSEYICCLQGTHTPFKPTAFVVSIRAHSTNSSTSYVAAHVSYSSRAPSAVFGIAPNASTAIPPEVSVLLLHRAAGKRTLRCVIRKQRPSIIV